MKTEWEEETNCAHITQQQSFEIVIFFMVIHKFYYVAKMNEWMLFPIEMLRNILLHMLNATLLWHLSSNYLYLVWLNREQELGIISRLTYLYHKLY